MFIRYKFVLIIGLFFALFGCNSEEDKIADYDEDLYYQFKYVSLQDHDLDAYLFIPDETAGIGASFKTKINHEEDFKWEISAGPNFEMLIEDWGDNSNRMKEFRKSLKENSIFKITILKDEGNCIQYKSELIKNINTPEFKHISYHVYSVKNLGGCYYEIRNREKGNSREVVELMAKSIKSFKLK